MGGGRERERKPETDRNRETETGQEARRERERERETRLTRRDVMGGSGDEITRRDNQPPVHIYRVESEKNFPDKINVRNLRQFSVRKSAKKRKSSPSSLPRP